MIDNLWQHISGSMQPGRMTVDQMFAWNIRFEVIVKDEEEFNYLYSLQLMFGRELEMKTWAEWKEEYDVCATIDHRYKKVPLPFCFTTFPMHFSDLR